MENEIIKKLEAQEHKLDAIYESIEKMRKYFIMAFWITIIAFILPLMTLFFVIPSFLKLYTSAINF